MELSADNKSQNHSIKLESKEPKMALPSWLEVEALIPPVDPSKVKESPDSHRVGEIKEIARTMGLKDAERLTVATTREQSAFVADLFLRPSPLKLPNPLQSEAYIRRRVSAEAGHHSGAYSIPGDNTIVVPHGLDEKAIIADLAKDSGNSSDISKLAGKGSNDPYARHLALETVTHELAHLNDPQEVLTPQEARIREAGSDIAAYVVGKYRLMAEAEELSNQLKDISLNTKARSELEQKKTENIQSQLRHEDFYEKWVTIRENSPDFVHKTDLALRTVMNDQMIQGTLLNSLKQGGEGFLDLCDNFARKIYT